MSAHRFLLRSPTARALLAALTVLSLSGCVAGPDYTRPVLATPGHYLSEGPDAPVLADQRVVVVEHLPEQWWQAFQSPALNALVVASLTHNPNIDAARAALRAAQETALAQRGAYFPSVNASFVPTRQKSASTLASPVASNANIYNLYTAQLAISYAPDVFGLNRRTVESLDAQAEMQRFLLQATYLSLTSNMVNAAIAEATLRAQIQATEDVITSQQQIREIVSRQRALGQVADADVLAQDAALAATEASLPPLKKQLMLQRDLIIALAGRFPGDGAMPVFTLDSVSLPAQLPLTLPASIVEQRPDVRAAEAQLQSASAQVGVATANRLPNIVLGVNTWGSAAQNLSDLFKAGTGFWSLAASVSEPLFDANTLRHRQSAAEASYQQSAALYRATVINAFQNVADALQVISADSDGLRVARRAELAARQSLEIAQRQLELGDVSTIAVLAAEQAFQQAHLNLVIVQGNRLQDSVGLFQALGGGGWSTAEQPVASTPGEP